MAPNGCEVHYYLNPQVPTNPNGKNAHILLSPPPHTLFASQTVADWLLEHQRLTTPSRILGNDCPTAVLVADYTVSQQRWWQATLSTAHYPTGVALTAT